MRIKDKYLDSVPMYQRADKLDFSKVKSKLIIINKNRATFEDLKNTLNDYINIYNRTNKFKRAKVVSTIYRILDVVYSNTNESLEFKHIVLHLLKKKYKLSQDCSLLKDIEYAIESYKPRNLVVSNKYVDDSLLYYLRSRIKFSKSEKELIDWVEYHIPNCLHKFLAAVINRNSFISLNYLLPEECVFSPEEKNKLYRFRKLILNKFGIIQQEEYDYLNHKSPTLTYGVSYADKLCEYLPNFNLSAMKDHQNYVNEIFNKLKIAKQRKVKYYYMKVLNLYGLKSASNYNTINTNIKNVFNGYFSAELQLLGLYSIYKDAIYEKMMFMASYVDRRYKQNRQ